MDYQFDDFTLDLDRAALLQKGEEIALEPRAYALLSLLVRNHERMVSKDEIIEKVWDGRFITDAAISTVVKTTRRALEDDGVAQKYIRTVRGRGFRFVGNVRTVARAAAGNPADEPDLPPVSQGPSLAILPFRLVGETKAFSAIADAVPAELISCLSRLRWLRIVARGSTFRFRNDAPNLSVLHQTLGANYCLAGIVEILGPDLAISVELSDTRNQGVVWSERFTGKIDEIHQTRNKIATHVISALELHIPLNEANRARMSAPENLDAWGIYHLGLQHMYRFNRADNLTAASHFERAVMLDPNFARAHAARSFTSFQSAFLNYTADRAPDINNALRFAERCMELDPVDPFGNFNLGRAHWLLGDPESGLPWIDRAVSLSPNFAQGFYAHAWADVMAGRGDLALEQINKAIALSPLDPFLYAMLSTRGLAYMLQGDFDNASIWADRGARAPGAHYLIGAIAAAINHMKGDEAHAIQWARSVQERRPDATIGTFFAAFPFEDMTVRRSLTNALSKLGFREA